MDRETYKQLFRDLQAVRVRIYNAIPDMTAEQRASLATDLEQALGRLRGGEVVAAGLDLDELTRLEAAATPGPWGECCESSDWMICPMDTDGNYLDAVVMSSNVEDIAQEDADLIVALRNAAPALIAAARAGQNRTGGLN